MKISSGNFKLKKNLSELYFFLVGFVRTKKNYYKLVEKKTLERKNNFVISERNLDRRRERFPFLI